MLKRAHIRVRVATRDALGEISEAEELSLSEVADRALTEFVKEWEAEQEDLDDDDAETDDEDEDEESCDYHLCPTCSEPVSDDDEECPSCGEESDSADE